MTSTRRLAWFNSHTKKQKYTMTTTSPGYRAQVEVWNTLLRHGISDCLERTLSALLAATPYAGATRQLLTDDVTQGANKLSALLQVAVQGQPASILGWLHDYGVALARSGVEAADVLGLSTAVRRGISPALRNASHENPDVTFALIDGVMEAVEHGVKEVVRAHSEAQKAANAEAQRPAQTADITSLSRDLHLTNLYKLGVLGISICDSAGHIFDGNEAFLATIGYTAEEIRSGQVRWTDLTPPEWLPLDELANEQLKTKRETLLWEKEFLRKDGTRVPVLIAVVALDQNDGSGPLKCAAFVLNLEERAKAESQKTRALKSALYTSQVRFKRLFESGVVGILTCDIYGNIHEANDAYLDILGYTREDLELGRVQWASLTPLQWRHSDDVAIEQLKSKGVTQIWEKEFTRKDGTLVPVLIGVASLEGDNCITFVLDITERKRLEALRIRSAELEAQNTRIQESSRMKSQFLANMSHELRTPLNAIIGFADLLHDGDVPLSSQQQRELLEDILRSSRHLLQLINDILDLAKVESGKLEFHAEPIELSALVDEAVSTLQVLANNRQVELHVELHPEVDRVTLDITRFRQILYNYISNALKFTEPGGHVTVRVRPETGTSFRLEVADTGIGIAPNDIPRLFSQFEQLDAGTTKKHGGTGLGLALTKSIVEAQGGTVGITSVLGKGSTFFAILPREYTNLTDEAQQPLTTIHTEGVLTQPTARPLRVLVVEDIASDRYLITRTLRDAGYVVDEATNAQQAIASCAQRTYDVITLDLLLPDQSGLEAFHRIRTEGHNTTTPVIVVSVVAEKGLIEGYKAQAYLSKPINTIQLLTSVKQAPFLSNSL